ncbi:MAG: VPA1262 family N-terminal domain-containing protein, partial [Nostoc sp.]
MPTSTEMIRFTQRLFPEPSGGGFFPKGWCGDEPGSRLRFFEWLQSLTKNTTASKILIIDPYFGRSGITELIARAEATDTEYVVLTNTQVKSDDDLPELESGKDKLEEPLRATELKQVCKQLELLLNNLKFWLFDLRSKEGGKTQLFHDRYILVFDESGYIITGYHLSNSLQGATRKHPLLITPIPKP